MKKTLISFTVSTLLLAGCHSPLTDYVASNTPAIDHTNKQQTQIVQASLAANKLFDDIYTENLMASPMYQTYMGIKTDYDKWDDISDSYVIKMHHKNIADLARVQAIDSSLLDEQTKLSYRLLIQSLSHSINDHQWRFHNYPVNQMRGLHTQSVSMLINVHKIDDISDANAYISRLHGLKQLMEQLTKNLQVREERGILPPYFVFDYVINDAKNILKGQPFNGEQDSPLYGDFIKKIELLPIDIAEKNSLKKRAMAALQNDVSDGFNTLIAHLSAQKLRATKDDGVWKLPQGEAFYNNALQRTTTTKLTSPQIHQLGLDEVARIHLEMEHIMKRVSFQGSLSEFFEFMRTDRQFYYDNNEAGRQAYLTKATAYIDEMKTHLNDLFVIQPQAPLVVKKVEAFREKSAGKAFYNSPSPDGSRPGRYYANLYDMNNMPTYQMEALAFHEGVPGHHMQISLAMELKGVPKFRKYGHYTAYSEGWGLYSEYLPKEIGFYKDPYSDFGRLAMELWRACRLVVDTGIHQMRWTREQAIDYLLQNTPNPKGDVIKAIERYIVMPSQATAYKVGMIKILELRAQAKLALGDKFSLRQFHHAILKNGPVPLSVMQEQVNQYIKSNQ